MNRFGEDGRRLIEYTLSLPAVWAPGEREEHYRRLLNEPGYRDRPRYIRPPEFFDAAADAALEFPDVGEPAELPEFPDFPEV